MIKELLDRRSGLYSHRPASFVGYLITQGNHLLLMQYGEEWRKIRKMIHQYFMEPMCEKQHVRLQNAEAIQLMHDFLVSPQDHMEHPKRYSNSITNSLGKIEVLVDVAFPMTYECMLSLRYPNKDTPERLHGPSLLSHE